MDQEVKKIFDELNAELEGLPIPVVMSKLFLKIWDELNKNYEEIEAVRRINAIALDVSGLPGPNAVARLVNHYVSLRMGYDPLKVD